MSLYVAAYDIVIDAPRTSVARMLAEYGMRIQYSVFLVWLEPEELPELRRRLGPYLSQDDRFDLFPVDERRTRSRWSWQRPPESFDPVIVR